MPYINIPDSKIIGTIAKVIGKIEGDVSGKIIAKANEVQVKFRTEGCPTDIDRVADVVNKLNTASRSIDRRLDKFRKLPPKLETPLTALKAAIKIILTLPIPQSVPPGFGLPINITTKYADILNLLKEFVKQIGDDVTGLKYILSSPSGQLSSILNLLKRTEVAVKACQVQKALQDKIDSGELSTQTLKDAGLMDDNEIFIFSTLGPRLIDVDEGRSVSDISAETGLSNEEVASRLKDQSFGNDPDQAALDFLNALNKLEGGVLSLDLQNELRALLDSLRTLNDKDRTANSKYYHTGPDGTVYELKIILEVDGPKIAPRHFATATNPEGVVVFKGDKSFSSSTDVLLDELRFRIDNQLS